MRANVVELAKNHVELIEAAVGIEPALDKQRTGLTPYQRFDKLRGWLGVFTTHDPDVAPQQAVLPAIPAGTLGGAFGQISLRFRLAYANDRMSPRPAIHTLEAGISPLPRQPYWRPTAVFAEWLLHPATADPDKITSVPHTRGEILSYGGVLKTTGVSLMEVADPSIAGPAFPGTEAKLLLLEDLRDYYEQPPQAQTLAIVNHFQPEA